MNIGHTVKKFLQNDSNHYTRKLIIENCPEMDQWEVTAVIECEFAEDKISGFGSNENFSNAVILALEDLQESINELTIFPECECEDIVPNMGPI